MRLDAFVVLLALGMLLSQSLHADTRERRLGRDTFLSGDEVVVTAALPGNALVAGGRVSLQSSVAGDAAIAGGQLDLAGSLSDDLYAAGGQVNVATAVGRGARVAGGEVHMLRGSKVAHGLTVVAGRIRLDGDVGDYAVLTGGAIRVDGHIAGNLVATGADLQLGPSAVVEGTLTFRGPRAAVLEPGATVRGGIRNITYERPMWWRGWTIAAAALALLWLVGWVVVGGVLLIALPAATRAVTRAAQARPALALLLGFVVLLVVPAAIAVLMATLVGIPLALVALALYLALLPLGYLAGVAAIGDWLLDRGGHAPTLPRGRRLLAFIAALILMTIIAVIPFIGWFAAGVIWLIGIGAIGLAVAGRGTPPVRPLAL